MLFPNFVGPSYTSQSPNADAEMCMNWYVENMESVGAKTRNALYPCPGFTAFGSVAQSPVRGLFATGELTPRLFSVIGFKLYEFASDGTATDRGTVDSDSHPAVFAWNGAAGGQMMIATGGTLYVYTLATDNLAAIATFSALNIQQVVYLNNRFIALDAENSAYYWSALNDGSSWDLGHKTTRSTAPDPWVSMQVILGQLWLLGTQTSDVYFATTDPTDPYQPIPGAYLEQGCAAAFSLINVDSTLVWLGKNVNGRGVIWRSNGYTPERISTHAVEFAIQGYETIDDAVGFAYQDQGHSFYVLNFPTADATWVYDTVTRLWHQRGYWDSDANSFLTYRAQYYASAFGQQIVGDRSTGALYTMSVTTYTDVDGAVIRRVRRAPHTWDGSLLNWVFYPGLQIDMQTGIGLSGGTTPEVMLNWSDDGGLTYPIELQQAASAGDLGQYQTRVRFLQLGRSRDRVYQLVCTDTVPWRILQAVFNPEPILGTA